MGDSNKNKIVALRLAILFVLRMVRYVFLTTPFTYFKASSPDFLMIFVIGVALFENPLVAGIFGFLGGLLKDVASAGILGFNAFVYLIWAVLISVLVALLIRRNFINSLAVCAASCFTLKSFYYFDIFPPHSIMLFYLIYSHSYLLTVINCFRLVSEQRWQKD